MTNFLRPKQLWLLALLLAVLGLLTGGVAQAAPGDENWDNGFSVPGLNGSVRALAFDSSGNLYAGGDFTTAGGVAANGIAQWDGSSWSALGSGLGNAVRALAVDSSGNLYAGGAFTTAGGVTANRIVKWVGFEDSTDTTPPIITPNVSGTLGNNDWYVSDVNVSWTVSDDESAISATNGCDPTLINSDTAGMTLTCEASSDGGTNSVSVTIQRDATAPVVSVTGVADGATYILGDVPAASCTTSDALSGVATPASLSLSGGDADGVGTITATCDGAFDNAGNSGSASVVYTVITPQQAISNVQADIQSLVDNGTFKQGQAIGLTKPLDNAIRSLDKGNVEDACNQLQDFIAEVNAKTPEPLDAATAADLIDAAEAIRVAVGCG